MPETAGGDPVGTDQEETEELSLRQFTEGGNHKISKQKSQGFGAVSEWERSTWNVGFSGTWWWTEERRAICRSGALSPH